METQEHEGSRSHLIAPSPYPLDTEALKDLHELEVEGEPDSLGELIDTFLGDAPKLLEAIRTAVAQGDVDALRQPAHTLKSSSALFGARALSALCAELEAMGCAGTIAGAPERMSQVEAEYGRVKTALEIEAKVTALRRQHPKWGKQRIADELAKSNN